MKVHYMCDKKACGNNHDCHECKHTLKIEHASNDFEYEVTKYPVFDQAVISFQLPSHGWKTLEKSEFWKSALQYLAEIQKGHIRK